MGQVPPAPLLESQRASSTIPINIKAHFIGHAPPYDCTRRERGAFEREAA